MGSPPTLAPLSLGPTLTIGEVLVEMMAETRGLGMGEVQRFTGPFPSGAPAIFIDQVARLGAASTMIGAVGDDDFGTSCRERLERDGVDCSALATVTHLPTGVAFVRYQADGDRAFIYNIGASAAGVLSLSDETRAAIDQAGHLHVMGSSLSIASARPLTELALQVITGKGGTVSFDPNLRPELLGDLKGSALLGDLVQKANVFLPSGDELRLIDPEGQGDPMVALQDWLQAGGRECVVKQGRDGATAYLAGESHHQPALPAEEVDPTGAGDCFGATYVTCRRMSMPVPQALRYANAAGASAVAKLGPMEGASSLAELDRMLAASAQHV